MAAGWSLRPSSRRAHSLEARAQWAPAPQDDVRAPQDEVHWCVDLVQTSDAQYRAPRCRLRFTHRTPESIWFARKASPLGLQSPAAVLERIMNKAACSMTDRVRMRHPRAHTSGYRHDICTTISGHFPQTNPKSANEAKRENVGKTTFENERADLREQNSYRSPPDCNSATRRADYRADISSSTRVGGVSPAMN